MKSHQKIKQENKLEEKIKELNTIIEFVEVNELNHHLQDRYIQVLRHQKALVRDIDRKGRKIPVNTPSVCEITGCEVNSIREKEPPFKLEQNISLGYVNQPLIERILKNDIKHNTYEHLLNNVSLKAVKKCLGRKIVFDDLSDIESNIILIMEIFKHKSYYKKYIHIESFEKRITDIQKTIEDL